MKERKERAEEKERLRILAKHADHKTSHSLTSNSSAKSSITDIAVKNCASNNAAEQTTPHEPSPTEPHVKIFSNEPLRWPNDVFEGMLLGDILGGTNYAYESVRLQVKYTSKDKGTAQGASNYSPTDQWRIVISEWKYRTIFYYE